MKKLLIISLCFSFLIGHAQKNNINANKVTVSDSIWIAGKWVKKISTDTAFADAADNVIPSSKAIKSYMDSKGADSSSIGSLTKVTTVDNVTLLMASNYHQKGFKRASTAGYAKPGDGGGAVYIWIDTSTKSSDTAFVIKPVNVTGNGRWEYVPENNTYNAKAIGFKGDNSTDNYWAWLKFHNKIDRTKAAKLLVPDGNYIFSSGIEVTKPVDVTGSASTTFWFPARDTGVYIHGSMYGLVPTWKDMKIYAISKDTNDGKGAGTVKTLNQLDYKYHGIVVTTIVNFDKVVARGFSGHGWRVYGSVGDFATAIQSGGSGYANGTYSSVNFTGGSGTEMMGDITVSGGTVTAVNVLRPGNHYMLGDILSASFGGGSGFQLKVTGESSNASGCRFYACGSEANNGAGMVFSGPDANQCVVNSLDFRENVMTGIYDTSFLGNQFFGCMGHLNGFNSGAGWGHYRIGLNVNGRSSLVSCYGESNGAGSSFIGGQSYSIGGLHEEGLIGSGRILNNGSWNLMNVDGEVHIGGIADAGAYNLQVTGGVYFNGNQQNGGTNPDLLLDGNASSYNTSFRMKAGGNGPNAYSMLKTSSGLDIYSFAHQVFYTSANAGTSYTEQMRIKNTGQLQFRGYDTTTTFVVGLPRKYAAFDSLGNLIAVPAPTGSTGGTGGTSTTINNNGDDRIITGSATANTLEAENDFRWDGVNKRLMVGYTSSVDNTWLHQLNGSLWVGSGTTKNFTVDANGNAATRQNFTVGGGTNGDQLFVASLAGPKLTVLQTSSDSYIRAWNGLNLGSGQSNDRLIISSSGVVKIGNLGTTGNRLVGRNATSDLYDTGIDPANIAAGLSVINDADYTVGAGVSNVVYRSMTAGRTVTLPTAASSTNRRITIRNGGDGAFNITLSIAVRSNTTTTISTLAAAESITIMSDGTDWWVVK